MIIYLGESVSKKQPTKRQARRKIRERQKLATRIITISFLVILIIVVALLTTSTIKNKEKSMKMPELVGTKQYSFAPPLFIDVEKKYYAQVKMAKGGEFTIQLFPDKAPLTVNNFVFLSQEGYYDGVTFHRVLEGFMAQGGDPTGTGAGGPGYKFVNEVSDLKFDKPGVVAMANAGKNTNGSQFFIMFNAYGLSPSDYTIFGQVIEGMEIVNSITLRDPSKSPDFPGDTIVQITITEGE
jgi:cyclophilin family peptidyl-prolyl cis-trans isomerase